MIVWYTDETVPDVHIPNAIQVRALPLSSEPECMELCDLSTAYVIFEIIKQRVVNSAACQLNPFIFYWAALFE